MPIQANLTLAVGGAIQNGLITLLGVGLTVRPPEPQPMAVHALIFIPRQEAGRHRWRVELIYASGDPVRLARPIPGIPPNFVFENEADVRGLDDPKLTTPLTTGPFISLPPFPLPKGREYLWRLTVDGETRDEWTSRFRTTPPVAQQQTGPRLRRL
jgi:hypothetical protein